MTSVTCSLIFSNASLRRVLSNYMIMILRSAPQGCSTDLRNGNSCNNNNNNKFKWVTYSPNAGILKWERNGNHQVIDCSTKWSIDRLVGGLVDCLADQWLNYLIDWLINRDEVRSTRGGINSTRFSRKLTHVPPRFLHICFSPISLCIYTINCAIHDL